MQKKSGYNKKTQITDINVIFKDIKANNIKDFRTKAIELVNKLFRNKEIEIKDIRDNVGITKKNIKETYSKVLSEEKINSANKLGDIIKESIYGYTTTSNENISIFILQLSIKMLMIYLKLLLKKIVHEVARNFIIIS